MKCSNCGYISFDYNQSCPKCDKDISAERAKLNLPDYRSDPPFLLGALTGQVNESEIEIQMDYSADIEVVDRQRDMSLVNSIETKTDETLPENAEKITVVIDKKKGRIWAGA
jgi:rubredoxin